MENNDKFIGQMLEGRYEIMEVIGEGGMAVVYRALDHRLNRYVAVKVMRAEMANDEEFRRRFNAESQAVAMLSHPNIVDVHDVSHNDELEYIVMELIVGITLKEYMNHRGALPWKEALHFSRQICLALAHAHERGIIHRDIKPHNIMLLRDGTVKVGDFGIAALESEVSEDNGLAVGSIHYVAPEQARGDNPDGRNDIYSLGVVMYEMLTAKQPYSGDSIAEVAVQHMSDSLVPIHELAPDTPPELERIILKAMSVSLEERYQSAREMLKDLDAFRLSQNKIEETVNSESPAVKPVRSVSELSREKYTVRRRRSQRVSYLSGTFALLFVFSALFVFLWNFWLKEVFYPSERIELPDFVGLNYEAVISSAQYATMYDFEVTYVVDTLNPAGLILEQQPESGRSMMVVPNGIKVAIKVSTGVSSVLVPDVHDMDYREAINLLSASGFNVEIENGTSDIVEKDRVISTSPVAGEELITGSTVYMTVSVGQQLSMVEVPNLVGLSEEAAIEKITGAGLSYGGTNRVQSDYESGTVIEQSIEPFIYIDEHAKIYLTVSSGTRG